MRHMLRITVGVAILVACHAGRASAADPARGAKSKAPANAATSNSSVAEKLVREALEAELAGDAAERARLLEAAMKEDPQSTAAQWHSGAIKVGKEWLAFDEVARRNAENARLAEYRRRRESLVDTADGQRELARWCQRSQLVDEAAVHWQAVLSFAPDDAEAMRALKLKLHNGRLLNPRELAAARAWDAREKEAARKWQPQIIKWRDAIVEGNPTERQAAVDGLNSIRDPAAIPALKAVLLRNDRGAKQPELYRAYISVLSKMPDEEATHALLEQALVGDVELAAPGLKGRPLASYVPYLIAALPSDVKLSARGDVMYSPTGWILQEREFTIQIPELNYSSTRVVRDATEVLAIPGWDGDNPALRWVPFAVTDKVQNVVADAIQFKTQLEAQQRRIDQDVSQRRSRIEKALLASTTFEQVDSRAEWLAQLQLALETYTPAQFPENEPVSSRETIERRSLLVLRSPSCFPAGTLVATQLGSAAIESLKPGDRVLSQDPETGELAYQAMRGVTLRPAAPLVEIEAGGETIRATRGHPFWINGQGWLMAKHLKAGQYLHTPDGPLKIERIGEQPAQEAYNLVVSDFATYFVGPQKILVHDNQPLQGTGMLVPGLAARDVKP